jgi:hypothetical protein
MEVDSLSDLESFRLPCWSYRLCESQAGLGKALTQNLRRIGNDSQPKLSGADPVRAARREIHQFCTRHSRGGLGYVRNLNIQRNDIVGGEKEDLRVLLALQQQIDVRTALDRIGAGAESLERDVRVDSAKSRRGDGGP